MSIVEEYEAEAEIAAGRIGAATMNTVTSTTQPPSSTSFEKVGKIDWFIFFQLAEWVNFEQDEMGVPLCLSVQYSTVQVWFNDILGDRIFVYRALHWIEYHC